MNKVQEFFEVIGGLLSVVILIALAVFVVVVLPAFVGILLGLGIHKLVDAII